MSDFPSSARVVIIGGGAVGASALYHLCKAGWTDCVLLEKNELTAGSTWHAAGNVPTFSSSWSIMNMQRYSAELYRGLGAAVDYPMNYHVTGSVRLGHSKERLQEFQRVKGMGRYQGMDLEILTPDEVRGKYPFVETHDLTGALYDPYDGDIDPAQLTQALAKGARQMGARIERFCPATGVRREGDEWVITTPKGEIRCEIVVNAAGYYAREVAKWFGRDLPMMVMSHQYMLFDTIPELESWSREAGHKLPLLRDVDSSYYLRQEKYGFNLGPYEGNCRAHWTTPDDPFPEDFSFQLFPDDLERLEFYIEDAMARVPALGTVGVSKVINGPIPYAPDGLPLMGPMPGVRNAYEACVFTFGITQAGGAGKVMAEWITEGQTEWDMWSCDPRRYTDYTDPAYCVDKAVETYGHEYAMHFPWHRWPAGADRRLSPVHGTVKALGGVFGAYNGWERANYYAKPGDDISEAATETWGRSGPWEPRIREECEAVRDNVGVLDLPGFSRFRLKGPGAAAWLDTLCTGRLPSVGRIGLLYFADDRGRVVTEMSAMRLDEDFNFRIFYGHFGARPCPGLRERILCRWYDLVVCTPDYAQAHVSDSGTLVDAQLLIDGNYNVWDNWFAQTGLAHPGPARDVTHFNETSLCLSTPLTGGGITIGDTILAFPSIRAGRLALPFRHGLESEQCYALFDRAGRLHTSAETSFLEWLSDVVRQHETEVSAFLQESGIDIRHGRKGINDVDVLDVPVASLCRNGF